MSFPSGYKRLEYIQSSGTQYVDTKFKANNNTRVLIDAEYIDTSGDYPILFGARTDVGQNMFSLMYNTSYFRSDYNTTYTQQWESAATGRRIYDKNKETTTINGVSKSYTNSAFQCDANLTLLCLNNNGTKQWFASAKVYSCQIYDNGTLVRDYIPCQTTAGEIGLWDDVNSVFYGNAGTGAFTAGPEVGVATPENFRLSSSTETTATLSWDAVDGATGYKLYRDGILIATLTDTSYTDTIQPFTSYLYTLTAYNDSGESDPATISVQVIIPPEAPSNFRASSASMTAISLAWDAVTGAESYQLSRDGAVIYTGEYPSYTDRGLTAETAYTYTLSAVNTAGSSAETTLEVATTQLILVTDRTAADVAARNDKGTYNASDLNRVGYAIQYLSAYLARCGITTSVSPKYEWLDKDYPTDSDMQTYLDDIATLRAAITLPNTTAETPADMEKLTYQEANDIESILVVLDKMIGKMNSIVDAGWSSETAYPGLFYFKEAKV